MYFDEILAIAPYSPAKQNKQKIMTQRMKELSILHYANCPEYKKMMDSIGFVPDDIVDYEHIPFLPVRLFKELSLKSIAEEDVFKVLTSSGTTGQRVSKIYLNKKSAAYQQKVLSKIMADFIGNKRMPMLIIDSPSVLKDRTMFSARGAGILGFSIFGNDRTYALDDDMKLNIAAVQSFIEKHQGKKIFIFGFTFMIWQHFYKELVELKKKGISFDFSNGILFHGGGWKKLIQESVSTADFNKCLSTVCGLSSIHDYYGMVEQTGTIYVQCEYGHIHASVFSDIIIRRALDFSVAEVGEKGIIQVVSMLPESYPGHSLLTEDTGVCLGEDDCSCGRKGKYFKILGRLENAEIRGCSDTYAAKYR